MLLLGRRKGEMAGKMLDDSYEFIINWDDGQNMQVEFVESSLLTNETVILTEKQVNRLRLLTVKDALELFSKAR